MKIFPSYLSTLIALLGLAVAGRVTAQTFTTLHSFDGVNGARPEAGLAISGNTLFGTTYYGNANAGSLFSVNNDGSGFTNFAAFNSSGANPQADMIVSGNTLYGTTAGGGVAGGDIFSVPVGGTGGLTALHVFRGGANDGAEAHAGVVLSGNTLYGTTVAGGDSGGGTVYAFNSNSISVLHSFTGGGGGSDGQSPEGPLVLANNVLYGTTDEGASAQGTVFKVNTDKTGFMVLHTFTGGTNGANSAAGLVLSGDTLYGTTVNGGNFGDGIVFKVNTDGTGFADMHDFKGPFTDGYQPYAGLVLSGGILYGTTSHGGAGNQGTVFAIKTDGTGYQLLYSFSALHDGTNSDGADPQADLLVSGNTLYGTTELGGATGNGAVFSLSLAPVPTTIDPANHYAWGANLGWLDARGDTNNGVVIGEYVCSGYIYSANFGWINLGNGSPTNGIYYQNLSTNDFGVNQDGLGNLRGYAWGANLGWINFETNGAPKVDLRTGIMSGYAYSANWGWISLSNAFAYVQTDTIQPGALDASGLPIAWELQNFGQTGVDPNADPDGDGMNNLQEYLAGTDPNDAGSNFRITAESFSSGGTNGSLTWSSVPSRFYHIQKNPALATTNWTESSLGLVSPSAGLATTGSFTDTNAPMRFYRVQAVLPLSP